MEYEKTIVTLVRSEVIWTIDKNKIEFHEVCPLESYCSMKDASKELCKEVSIEIGEEQAHEWDLYIKGENVEFDILTEVNMEFQRINPSTGCYEKKFIILRVESHPLMK